MSPGMMEARRSHRRHSRSHRSLPQNTVLAPSLNMTVACIGLAIARNHQPCSLSAPDQELEDAGFTDCGQCVYVGPMDKFDPDKMFPDFDFDNVPVAILNCQKKELPGCLVRWTQTASRCSRACGAKSAMRFAWPLHKLELLCVHGLSFACDPWALVDVSLQLRMCVACQLCLK